MDRDLYVSEIFGPTIQGEGPGIGRNVTFLRLAGCNLHCTWCDSKYTWNFGKVPAGTPQYQNARRWVYDRASEVTRMSVRDVRDALYRHRVAGTGPTGLVITGGEPLLQQAAIAQLLMELPDSDWSFVSFETNGTVPIGELMAFWLDGRTGPGPMVMFVVSPKLPHAEAGVKATDVDYGTWIQLDAVFKFVCRSVEDFDYIEALRLPARRVYIMPEGITPTAVLSNGRALAEGAITRGWQLTTRLHTLIWGNERKR